MEAAVTTYRSNKQNNADIYTQKHQMENNSSNSRTTWAKMKVFVLCCLLLAATGGRRAQAQSIDDLGVVWSKHYGSGWIRGIKAQTDGSYLACGTGVDRTQGLIIEIDESGNEVRRLTSTIPASYPNTIPVNRADLIFKAAFKTSDGGVLAFGEFMNIDAPYEHKQYTWGITAPENDPRHFTESEYLLNGVWIVKFNSAGTEVKNELTRGRGITDAWRTNDGNFLLGGFDANETEDQDITNKGKDITLLRKYNHEGNTLQDLRMDRREVTSFYQYTDGSFLITTPDRLFRINADLTTVGTAFHYYDYPNGPSRLPGANNPFANSISPNSEGGAFISTNLYSVDGDHSAYYTAMNGVGLYKLDENNTHVYNKQIIPSDTILSAPLLLPGADSIYVGTATLRDTQYNAFGMGHRSSNLRMERYRHNLRLSHGSALSDGDEADGRQSGRRILLRRQEPGHRGGRHRQALHLRTVQARRRRRDGDLPRRRSLHAPRTHREIHRQ